METNEKLQTFHLDLGGLGQRFTVIIALMSHLTITQKFIQKLHFNTFAIFIITFTFKRVYWFVLTTRIVSSLGLEQAPKSFWLITF
jgi:hypothetical protein